MLCPAQERGAEAVDHKDAAQSCRLVKLLHAVQGWDRTCHCRHGTSNTLNMQRILYACHALARGLTG